MTAEKSAIVGGGCFWCVEAVMERLQGVRRVVSGYAAGDTLNPTYEDICEGTTGHAEVVRVTYDPQQITYAEILDVFFQAHDPTTRNRQGADVGTQYRSIILYQSEEEKEQAQQAKAAAQNRWPNPIVTEIEPLETFYPAERFHQGYYSSNPNAPYCRAVIHPKLSKLGML